MTAAGRLRHRLHKGAANNATISPLLKSTARPFFSVNLVLEHTTAISHCSSLPASQRLAAWLCTTLPNHTPQCPPEEHRPAFLGNGVAMLHIHVHRADFLKACRSPVSTGACEAGAAHR